MKSEVKAKLLGVKLGACKLLLEAKRDARQHGTDSTYSIQIKAEEIIRDCDGVFKEEKILIDLIREEVQKEHKENK